MGTLVKGSIEIIKGEKVTKIVKLRINNGLDPYDLTGATEITVCLPNEDGTNLEVKLSDTDVEVLGNAQLGNFSFSVSAVNSALLKVGKDLDFGIKIDFGAGNIDFINMPAALTIYSANC